MPSRPGNSDQEPGQSRADDSGGPGTHRQQGVSFLWSAFLHAQATTMLAAVSSTWAAGPVLPVVIEVGSRYMHIPRVTRPPRRPVGYQADRFRANAFAERVLTEYETRTAAASSVHPGPTRRLPASP